MRHYLVCPNCGHDVAEVVTDASQVRTVNPQPPKASRGPSEHRLAAREVVAEYWTERVRPNRGGRVPTDLLMRDFTRWAERNGKPALSSRMLGAVLRDLGAVPYRSSGKRYYADILLEV